MTQQGHRGSVHAKCRQRATERKKKETGEKIGKWNHDNDHTQLGEEMLAQRAQLHTCAVTISLHASALDSCVDKQIQTLWAVRARETL